ncbi:unnamed protein product [Schistosoma margrebowiei]|uniref:Uncharacterized protein n=1 Tax=Schistosoma margrebowiei TaxID=48269 RepID=A0A3P8GEJ6_9TREM|nr:unnamed protein product [Schistosoma margrebowiei]
MLLLPLTPPTTPPLPPPLLLPEGVQRLSVANALRLFEKFSCNCGLEPDQGLDSHNKEFILKFD